MAMPNPNAFWAPWGYNKTGYRQAIDDYQRQRDLDYFAKWGYYPEQRASVLEAQGRADAEYKAAIEGLMGLQGQMADDPGFLAAQDFFTGAVEGRNVPYDERAIASLVAGVQDPIFGAMRGALGNLRSGFAARGLGRSGGLVDLENQYMTDAVMRAATGGGQMRADLMGRNMDFRGQAAGGLGSLQNARYANQIALQNALTQARLAKQFDPTTIRAGGTKTYEPVGGAAGGYNPPPRVTARANGASAPRYDATGAWGVTGVGSYRR